MSSKNLPLKYDPVSLNKVNSILTTHKDNVLIEYIKELYNLIEYQRQRIKEQEQIIIAVKHKEAWKRYDRPDSEYDTNTRKYVDKPPKSGNMSC